MVRQSRSGRISRPDRRAEGVDGVLLVSFGGPRGQQDVMPFLENVTAGRGIPRERLETVAEHYRARGGISPINAETEALVAAMQIALTRLGHGDVPVYLGNRNWTPTIDEALRTAARQGRRHLSVVLTSAYSGYSSCRQYRENVAASLGRVAGDDSRASAPALPRLSFVRPWGLEPRVVETWGRLAEEAVRRVMADTRPGVSRGGRQDDGHDGVHLVFVAHSIPTPAARAAGSPGAGDAYVRQLTQVAEQAAGHVQQQLDIRVPWSLAYCSRSGRPDQPWLEPDISDALATLAADGVRRVAAVPIGFVADHMEVVQDLDTVAAADAARLGVAWHRAPTLRDDPAVAGRLVELALAAGDNPGLCAAGCCPPGRPDARLPAAAFEVE